MPHVSAPEWLGILLGQGLRDGSFVLGFTSGLEVEFGDLEMWWNRRTVGASRGAGSWEFRVQSKNAG